MTLSIMGLFCDTQHKRHSTEMTLSITVLSAKSRYTEYRYAFIVMLSVIMLSVAAPFKDVPN
jgi:hypothetical protein